MRRLRHRVGRQDGMAVVVAILVLMIGLLFVGAAATRALSTNDTSRHDLYERQALQAANAGLRAAVSRMNALALDVNQLLNLNLQCVLSIAGQVNFSGDTGSTYCQVDSGHQPEQLGNGVSFDYRTSTVISIPPLVNTNTLLQMLLARRVVATGTSHGVTRRVYSDVVSLGTNSKKCSLLSVLGLCIGTYQTFELQLQGYHLATATDVTKYPSMNLRPYRECTAKSFAQLPSTQPDQGCY